MTKVSPGCAPVVRVGQLHHTRLSGSRSRESHSVGTFVDRTANTTRPLTSIDEIPTRSDQGRRAASLEPDSTIARSRAAFERALAASGIARAITRNAGVAPVAIAS